MVIRALASMLPLSTAMNRCLIALLFCSSLLAQGTDRPRAAAPQIDADIEVIHRTVLVDGAPYPATMTKPKGQGRFPAVFLIGGLGCYSLEHLPSDDPFARLLDGLTQRGYVTMRVDKIPKKNEGDLRQSEGPPCDSPRSDLQFAVRRSLAGLNALAGDDFVDRGRIFILAHSIGPLEGVLVAQKFSVRGFIAAETIGRSWLEYQMENARHQLRLFDVPYDQIDRTVRVVERCGHRFLIEKQTPEQILKDSPECKASVNTFGVAFTYLQQIADLDLAVEWKKVDVPVLVTYGTSDPSTTADESHYLVDMINGLHPGRASYVELAGMGHGLDRSPSPRAWLEAIQKHQHGPFDAEFLERVEAWLNPLAENSSKESRAAVPSLPGSGRRW
jgi:pimeloyl-ACP methyl ester carboxylesterase